MFHNLTRFEKTEYENQILSIGREFLPPCAVAVLDGSDATAEYWDWIAEEYHSETQENEARLEDAED